MEKLSSGGKEVQCGWLEDKYGISWQIVPETLGKMMLSPKFDKVHKEVMKMKKLDMEKLEKAFSS